ncbi:MAG TPA: hypothetical protein VFF98_11125 [Novosphingobium sp.]|nr:hypothetical protein [Novosphingobium sp.]HZV10193.1 hypothetical protein [Novosphingobium sp.]
MRTTYDAATVRLYHLDGAAEGGAAETLCYAPLAEALRVAAAQSAEVQEGLFIATDNDVIAYLDLVDEGGAG